MSQISNRSVKIELPPKLIPVFCGEARYRGAYGGRGSGKSRSFAKMTAARGYMLAMAGVRGTIVCGREYMNSLEDSSMEEVKMAILSEPWLADFYEIGEKYIRTKCRRIHYTFTGLHTNLNSLKSKARILLFWIDEGEDVSEMAWQKLRPTVRETGSEIWVTWNPEKENSPTDTRFRKAPPLRSKIVEINYQDNPWFPPELNEERLGDLSSLDDATYRWIWEGAYYRNSVAQVLHGKYHVQEFTPRPDWSGPYHGIDWGFSQDPTAACRLWVHNKELYVEREAYEVGVENDDLATFFMQEIPNIEHYEVFADNARPETIRHVKTDGSRGNGLPTRNNLPRIKPVDKWNGSVQDGINHLRSYKRINIHPRCVNALAEARHWSYKKDRHSGQVLPELIDANNHFWDAARYALMPLIKQGARSAGIMLPKHLRNTKKLRLY